MPRRPKEAKGGPERLLHEVAPVQFSDEAAREMVEQFVLGNDASKDSDWTAFFDIEDIEPAEA